MYLNNIISENIFLFFADKMTGMSVRSKLKFLTKTQFWTREQIVDYQNEKLRALIRHAYKNVPFYHDLFQGLRLIPEDIQTQDDLIKLPILTKDELKKNKDKLLAQNIKKRELLFTSSSGSTGEPFQFWLTKESDSIRKAAAIRGWNWMGFNLGDKYVKISMNPRTSLIKRMQDKMNNCLYLSSQQLTNNAFQVIQDELSRFDPKFIRCYPVPLLFLARQIKDSNSKYKGNSLLAISSTGSTLSEDVRKEIETVFKTKIFDAYSCEGGAVFAQCPTRQYYHPAEESAISEFISDNYTFSDPSNPVRLVTTDLFNYASPFIRYDTQDYLVLGESKLCTCGRHLINVKSIRGRDSDILVTPKGKYLIVENFVAYFEWIQEVDLIQVVQNAIDDIEINIVVNNKFNNDILQKIQNYWEEYIGDDVHVSINIVDDIKLTSSGKRRTVIRNPNIIINDRFVENQGNR